MSRSKQIGPAVAVASLALLAGAWAWRDLDAPSEVIPRGDARAEEGAPRVPPLPPGGEGRAAVGAAPRPEGEDGFWNVLASSVETRADEPAGKEVVLRMTEDFLGLSAEEARAFRAAALSAVEDVDRAWGVREESWVAVSSSAASDPELLGRLEEEIQVRYESEKERALQRVAAQLGGSERRERLRERLEEWFDALR